MDEAGKSRGSSRASTSKGSRPRSPASASAQQQQKPFLAGNFIPSTQEGSLNNNNNNNNNKKKKKKKAPLRLWRLDHADDDPSIQAAMEAFQQATVRVKRTAEDFEEKESGNQTATTKGRRGSLTKLMPGSISEEGATETAKEEESKENAEKKKKPLQKTRWTAAELKAAMQDEQEELNMLRAMSREQREEYLLVKEVEQLAERRRLEKKAEMDKLKSGEKAQGASIYDYGDDGSTDDISMYWSAEVAETEILPLISPERNVSKSKTAHQRKPNFVEGEIKRLRELPTSPSRRTGKVEGPNSYHSPSLNPLPARRASQARRAIRRFQRGETRKALGEELVEVESGTGVALRYYNANNERRRPGSSGLAYSSETEGDGSSRPTSGRPVSGAGSSALTGPASPSSHLVGMKGSRRGSKKKKKRPNHGFLTRLPETLSDYHRPVVPPASSSAHAASRPRSPASPDAIMHTIFNLPLRTPRTRHPPAPDDSTARTHRRRDTNRSLESMEEASKKLNKSSPSRFSPLLSQQHYTPDDIDTARLIKDRYRLSHHKLGVSSLPRPIRIGGHDAESVREQISLVHAIRTAARSQDLTQPRTLDLLHALIPPSEVSFVTAAPIAPRELTGGPPLMSPSLMSSGGKKRTSGKKGGKTPKTPKSGKGKKKSGKKSPKTPKSGKGKKKSGKKKGKTPKSSKRKGQGKKAFSWDDISSLTSGVGGPQQRAVVPISHEMMARAAFQGVPPLSQQIERDIFLRDWSCIDISDLIKTVRGRAIVRNALWQNKYYQHLVELFYHYSCLTQPLGGLSKAEMIEMMSKAHAADRLLPPNFLHLVFEEVRVETKVSKVEAAEREKERLQAIQKTKQQLTARSRRKSAMFAALNAMEEKGDKEKKEEHVDSNKDKESAKSSPKHRRGPSTKHHLMANRTMEMKGQVLEREIIPMPVNPSTGRGRLTEKDEEQVRDFSGPTLSRAEFLEAVIRLAMDQFGDGTEFSLENKPNLALHKLFADRLSLHGLHIVRTNGDPEPLRKMLRESSLLQECVAQFSVKLRWRFDAYANASSATISEQAACDFRALTLMFLDFNLLGTAFTGAQLMQAIQQSRDLNFSDNSYLLRYPSFLELLVRLGMVMFTSESERRRKQLNDKAGHEGPPVPKPKNSHFKAYGAPKEEDNPDHRYIKPKAYSDYFYGEDAHGLEADIASCCRTLFALLCGPKFRDVSKISLDVDVKFRLQKSLNSSASPTSNWAAAETTADGGFPVLDFPALPQPLVAYRQAAQEARIAAASPRQPGGNPVATPPPAATASEREEEGEGEGGQGEGEDKEEGKMASQANEKEAGAKTKLSEFGKFDYVMEGVSLDVPFEELVVNSDDEEERVSEDEEREDEIRSAVTTGVISGDMEGDAGGDGDSGEDLREKSENEAERYERRKREQMDEILRKEEEVKALKKQVANMNDRERKMAMQRFASARHHSKLKALQKEMDKERREREVKRARQRKGRKKRVNKLSGAASDDETEPTVILGPPAPTVVVEDRRMRLARIIGEAAKDRLYKREPWRLEMMGSDVNLALLRPAKEDLEEKPADKKE